MTKGWADTPQGIIEWISVFDAGRYADISMVWDVTAPEEVRSTVVGCANSCDLILCSTTGRRRSSTCYFPMGHIGLAHLRVNAHSSRSRFVHSMVDYKRLPKEPDSALRALCT